MSGSPVDAADPREQLLENLMQMSALNVFGRAD
jgi:hypothetical protein